MGRKNFVGVPRYLVYGLRDPLTNEIRYVGKSSSGTDRPIQHTAPCMLTRDGNTYKSKWLQSLLSKDLKPEIVILQVTNKDNLDNAERDWIALGRSALGNRLTNLTDGGDGCSGRIMSEEAKRSISAKQKQLWAKAETVSAAKQRNSKPEAKLKRSKASREVAARPDVLAKRNANIRIGVTNMWSDAEKRARRIESMKRVVNEPAYAQARNTRIRLMWTDPVQRARLIAAMTNGRREAARKKKQQNSYV